MRFARFANASQQYKALGSFLQLGQIRADTVMGIAVGVLTYEQIVQIVQDERLSDAEKHTRIVVTLTVAAAAEAFIFLGVWGNSLDLKTLKTATIATPEGVEFDTNMYMANKGEGKGGKGTGKGGKNTAGKEPKAAAQDGDPPTGDRVLNDPVLIVDPNKLADKNIANQETHETKIEVEPLDTGTGKPAGKLTITKDDLGDLINGGDGPDSGSFKLIYRVKDREDICVALPRPRTGFSKAAWKKMVYEEYNALMELKARGFPVLETHGVIDIGGQLALVLQYIPNAASSKDLHNFVDQMWPESITQLRALRHQLEEEDVSPGDFQVLVDADGNIFINDSMRITYEYNIRDAYDIDDWIKLWKKKNPNG